MAFPITCPACGKAFQLATEIYDKKVSGKVVSIKCKQCQVGIRIDATQPGELKVLGSTPGGGQESVGAKPPTAPTAPAAATAPAAEKAAATGAPVRARQPTLIGMMMPGGQVVTKGAAPESPAGPAQLWAVDSRGAGDDRELTEAEIAGELAAGTLSAETLVWRDGQADWLELSKVPELAKHLTPPKPAPPARAKQPSAPLIDTPRAKQPSAPLIDTPRAKQPSAPLIEPPRAKQPSAPLIEPPRAKQPSAPLIEPPLIEPPRAKQPSAPLIEPPRAKQPSAPLIEPPRGRLPSAPGLPPPRAKLPSAPGLAAPRAKLPSAPGLPPPRAKLPSAPVIPGLDEEEATAIYDRSSPEGAALFAELGMPSEDAAPPPPPPPPPPAAGAPPAWAPSAVAAPPPLPKSSPAAAPPPPPVPQAPIPWGGPAAPAPPPAAAGAPMAAAPIPFNVVATTDLDFPTERSKRPLVIGIVVALVAVVGIVVAVQSSSSAPPIPTVVPVAPVPIATEDRPTTNTTTQTPTSSDTSGSGTPAAPTPGGNFSDLFAAGVQKAERSGGGQASSRRFDPEEAKKAVGGVLHAVAACKEAGGSIGQSNAAITFDASGKVSSVTVGDPFSGTSTGTCIISALKQARMEPFSGLPGTISQAVSLR